MGFNDFEFLDGFIENQEDRSADLLRPEKLIISGNGNTHKSTPPR